MLCKFNLPASFCQCRPPLIYRLSKCEFAMVRGHAKEVSQQRAQKKADEKAKSVKRSSTEVVCNGMRQI